MADKTIPTGVTVTPTTSDKLLLFDATDSFRIKDVLISALQTLFSGAPGAIGDTTPATELNVTGDTTLIGPLDVTGRITQSAAVFYDEFWNGDDPAWTTRTSTGSISAQNAVNGWQRLTTGSTATNEESLDWNDICPFINTQQPALEVRIQLEQITDMEVDIGLIEASGGSDDDYILFKFDASAGANWNLEASNAGTSSSDAGSAATTSQTTLRFEFTSDTELEWFIDDVSQGTITSNVPTIQLQPVVAVRTEAAAAHYIDIDFMKIWQDRS